MPPKKLLIPNFATDSDEADWWESNRSAVESDLRAAMRANQTLSLDQVLAQARRKRELQPVTIRLASEDLDVARRLADEMGIGYQTYIKLLLHDALQKATGSPLRVKK